MHNSESRSINSNHVFYILAKKADSPSVTPNSQSRHLGRSNISTKFKVSFQENRQLLTFQSNASFISELLKV